MKWLRLVIFLSVGVLILSGCANEVPSEEVKTLVNQLVEDYQLYFHQSIDLNDYSVGVYESTDLAEEDTQVNYKGDRVGLVLDREPKENDVNRIVGEYIEGQLIGIRFDINTKDSEYHEQSLEQLAVSFLSEHQLADTVSLLDSSKDGNDVIYRFEDLNQRIIKVYVNEDIRQVVGFLLNDGANL
ncbi:hypothetical protein [Turicibacter sanguinis]|uniref:hypothetical protein n=1 Tax=Turicibacter sanguinis TaxID=154288 RepID=UPI0032EB2C79